MTLTRRRFMTSIALAGAYAAWPFKDVLAHAPLYTWRGILLGADVQMTFAHESPETAEQIAKKCVGEIKRLENIFTLYDSHSELSRLNANGYIDTPSTEFIDIVKRANHMNTLTDGAFDITVRPLENGVKNASIGMDKLEFNEEHIRFKGENMALTLNGIAQGYITDRATDLLKQEGLTNVLVELGEKRAIGDHPSGRPWFLAADGYDAPIPLIDQALATSASRSPNDGKPHIFDPKTALPVTSHKMISVKATNATDADALSTAFMGMNAQAIGDIKNSHKDILAVYTS